MPARQSPWAEAMSAEGGNTQRRQTRTPMQNWNYVQISDHQVSTPSIEPHGCADFHFAGSEGYALFSGGILHATCLI
jgi:hypothetical protein